MDKAIEKDTHFQITFYEAVLEHVPDYMQVAELLGCLYTEVGRIDDGLRMDELCVALDPRNPNSFYNLACSLCLKRRNEAALKALAKAIELGYKDFKWMMQDNDLKGLRGHPRFQAIASKLKEIQP